MKLKEDKVKLEEDKNSIFQTKVKLKSRKAHRREIRKSKPSKIEKKVEAKSGTLRFSTNWTPLTPFLGWGYQILPPPPLPVWAQFKLCVRPWPILPEHSFPGVNAEKHAQISTRANTFFSLLNSSVGRSEENALINGPVRNACWGLCKKTSFTDGSRGSSRFGSWSNNWIVWHTDRTWRAGLHFSLRISKHIRPTRSIFGLEDERKKKKNSHVERQNTPDTDQSRAVR